MTHRVSVVILNYHGEKHLPRCLDSLNAQEFQDWDVSLVDNSPDDGLIERLSTSDPLRDWLENNRAKIYTNPRNIGFAAGVNRGIAESDGEYILLLNQDVYLSPPFLGELVSVLDSDEKIASSTGKLLRITGKGEKEIIDSTGHMFFDDRIVINRGKDETDTGRYDEACELFGVSAAAALYRRSALEEIAYEGDIFDETFFAYLEDIDLDFRLLRAGFRSSYTPSAIANHALAGSGGRKSFAIRFKAHSNRYRIIWKQDTFPLLIRDILPVMRQELLQFFRTLFTSPLLLLSNIVFIFSIPGLLKQRQMINKMAKCSFADIYNIWINRGRFLR